MFRSAFILLFVFLASGVQEPELLLEMVSLLQRQVRNREGSIGGRNFSKLLPLITESQVFQGSRFQTLLMFLEFNLNQLSICCFYLFQGIVLSLNLVSCDLTVDSDWLMFLYTQFIFTDWAHFLGSEFTGTQQSFLNSRFHL